MKIDALFLRDISLIWSLFHVLVLFVLFYESRYSKRKTLFLTFLFMGGLFLLMSMRFSVANSRWISRMRSPVSGLDNASIFWNAKTEEFSEMSSFFDVM